MPLVSMSTTISTANATIKDWITESFTRRRILARRWVMSSAESDSVACCDTITDRPHRAVRESTLLALWSWSARLA